MDETEFKFPDEVDQNKPKNEEESPEIEIEIEDDTPEEDRNRKPMPKEIVEKLEKDELEAYDDDVKAKILQMRKVYHDERREKESALREQHEAVSLARRLMDENKKIRGVLQAGEKEYVQSIQNTASLQLEMAKKAYREAYESGDVDAQMDAQQAMQEANIRLMQTKNSRCLLYKSIKMRYKLLLSSINRPKRRMFLSQIQRQKRGKNATLGLALIKE